MSLTELSFSLIQLIQLKPQKYNPNKGGFPLNDLGIKEEVEKKPALTCIGFASIMLHQVLRKGHVLGVRLLHLAVAPWQGFIVCHFSVLVVLLAEWSPRSKEGNGVDSVEGGKEEPGNEKSMCSLVTELLFRPSVEGVEG